ncbi:MAG: plastocyanin/azurin family copper-binding protein, partial [Chloroflexota bacterium]
MLSLSPKFIRQTFITLILCSVLLSLTAAQETPAQTAVALAPHTIVYTSSGFSPDELTVQVGDTVTWENQTDQMLSVASQNQYLIFLPLIRNGDQGSKSSQASSITAADSMPFELSIPAGESESYTFPEAGQYKFFVADDPDQGGMITVEDSTVIPPAAAAECDGAPSDVVEGDPINDGEEIGVFYATAEDRTLIRWQWDDCETAQFEVYRSVNGGPETLVGLVAPVTNPAEAEDILNNTEPRWPDLFAYFQGVFLNAQDFNSEQNYAGSNDLLNFIYANGLAGQHWTNQFYPLALVAGWGYLDTDVKAGNLYAYRVVATGLDNDLELGSVDNVAAGQKTPIPVPTNFVGIDLDPSTSPWTEAKDGNWGLAQKNRRFDKQIYLTWDTPAGETSPPNQTIGYNICAMEPSGPVPIPYPTIGTPPSSPPPGPDQTNNVILPGALPVAADGPDYHARLDMADYEENTYVMGGIDLLNQPLCVTGNEANLSTPLMIRAHDFIPPAQPNSLELTQVGNTIEIEVTLQKETKGHAGLIIQRTHTLQCEEGDICWQDV